ncbi:MAG TPA: permease, partial [Luteimonas sp.]|nr:permease [Luteimonas sp.]
MTAARMAWRQLRRDLAAGEVRILLAALALAVLAITAVGFVTERAERALVLQANQLLGGDAVVRSRSPVEGAIREAASAPGLRHSETLEFNTMVRVGDA